MSNSDNSTTASPPPGTDAGGADNHHGHAAHRDDRVSGGCLFCRLAGEMERRLDRHAETFEHLAAAQHEVLQAVRSFVDKELGGLADRLRRYREKRDAPPGAGRVTHIDVD